MPNKYTKTLSLYIFNFDKTCIAGGAARIAARYNNFITFVKGKLLFSLV